MAHGTDGTRRTFDDVGLYIGGGRQDRFPGAGTMDAVFGRGGDDRLLGGRRGDDLLGGAGDDRLIDDAGADHLDGGDGADRLRGGAAADSLRGGGGRDRLDEGVGHGGLEGGRGDDRLTGGPGGDAFTIAPDSGDDVITDFAAGPGMLDHLAVRDIEPEDLRFEDTEAGVRISWDLAAGEGSVLLEGLSKRDLAQDDFMFADDRKVIQPTGLDAARVTATAFVRDEGDAQTPPALTADDPAAETFRFDEFLVRIGGGGPDAFRGTAARDHLIGQRGADRHAGGADDYDLAGGGGADLLAGGAGQDHLLGGGGRDRLFGGGEADVLTGENGRDALFAGAGHDMVDGGAGDDVLDGGDGADAFVVGPDSGDDVVVGGFDAGPGAFDHIAFVDLGPAQVRVEDAARGGDSGVLVSWSADADKGAEGSIFLVGLTTGEMAQDDFMFNAAEGLEGMFENNAELQVEGSRYIFQDEPPVMADAAASPGDWML